MNLLRRSALLLLLLSTRADSLAATGQFEQAFPINGPPETRWRIIWETSPHVPGRSEVLSIREAYFKRSCDEAWIQVLGDCRLAEIFVPYNSGTRIYDISGYSFQLEPIPLKGLGPVCLGQFELFDNDRVAKEIHDDHLLWMNASDQARRAEEIHLWSVLAAGNYRYIILYRFRSDGTIGFRLGGTAHNLMSTKNDEATHLHVGCWRLNVVLGDAAKTDVQHVRYVTQSSGGSGTVISPFNGGREGGIEWAPQEFTTLRIRSQVVANGHQPSSRIAYDLMPMRSGNARLFGQGEEFTHKDVWVTVTKPMEMMYRDLPDYVADNEQLTNAKTIWHQSGLMHSPRDEDFGKVGHDSWDGSAITAWAGCDLKPRDFFSETPMYP